MDVADLDEAARFRTALFGVESSRFHQCAVLPERDVDGYRWRVFRDTQGAGALRRPDLKAELVRRWCGRGSRTS